MWPSEDLARVAAILRPGGVLRLRDLVYSREPDDVERVIEPWLAAGAERPEAGWTRAKLETHGREEYSSFSWALEAMLEHAGFAIREAAYSPSRIYAAYTCVKA